MLQNCGVSVVAESESDGCFTSEWIVCKDLVALFTQIVLLGTFIGFGSILDGSGECEFVKLIQLAFD